MRITILPKCDAERVAAMKKPNTKRSCIKYYLSNLRIVAAHERRPPSGVILKQANS